MSWNKIEVTAFSGLNSTTSPELIKEGEARDIHNFRMEKVGKLVSRDGYKIGVFAHHDFNVFDGSKSPQNERYFDNLGIIGIGELILKDQWPLMDTDRFMVYAIRSGQMDSQKQNSTRHNNYMCFLLCPLTGTHANKIFTSHNMYATLSSSPLKNDIDNKRDRFAQGTFKDTDLEEMYSCDAFEIPRVKNGFLKDILDGFKTADELVSSPQPINYYSVIESGSQYDLNWEIGDISYSGVNPKKYYKLSGEEANSWIKKHVHMSQYRNMCVISDKVNGDMLLSDRYKKEYPKLLNNNRIHLGPNKLDHFDANTIVLDYQLNTGEKNEKIIHGMGLYKYVLPEDTYVVSEDHFENKLSNYDYFPESKDFKNSPQVKSLQKAWKIAFTDATNYKTLMSFTYFYTGRDNNGWVGPGVSATLPPNSIDSNDGPITSVVNTNKSERYVFTNADTPSKYKDLLGKVELDKDEYFDKTGKKIIDYSSNVYVWEDYPIEYKPSNGILDLGNVFLKQIDRIFSKTTDGTPKVSKLVVQDKYGKQVPLGVWKYRFVFEYEDGVYGAPSEEIIVNDILWSATEDSENNNYARPNQVVGDSWFGDVHSLATHFDKFGLSQYPSLFTPTGNISSFGKKIKSLKTKIYEGGVFEYGIFPDDTIFDTWNKYKKSNLAVTTTARFSDSLLELKGWAYESGFFWRQGLKHDVAWTNVWKDILTMGDGGECIFLNKGHIVVPIFQTGDLVTFNSLVDDHGRIRIGYSDNANSREGMSPNYPYLPIAVQKQLIFPLSSSLQFSLPVPGNFVQSIPFYECTFSALIGKPKSDLYLNFIRDQYEQNNNDITTTPGLQSILDNERTNTPLRIIKKENESFTSIYNDIPAEVLDRLILQGVCKIDLLDYKENVYLGVEDPGSLTKHSGNSSYSLTRRSDNSSLTPILEHSMERAAEPFFVGNFVNIPGFSFDNLEIKIYGEGERFLGPEQLTSYFPSSLLFGAPRVSINIPADKVPPRAKKIKIFRTRASHDNAFLPTDFGLVEEKELKQDANGAQLAFSYFDEIKDGAIDFSDQARDYEGMRTELKSRFNISLMERTFFANFIERYQPIKPWEGIKAVNMASGTSVGFDYPGTVKYKVVYEDDRKIQSESTDYEYSLTNASGKQVIVLYNIPMPFDSYIRKVKVYREFVSGSNEYYKIYDYDPIRDDKDKGYPESIVVDLGETDHSNKDLYVDKGIDTEDYESGLRWSEPYRPDWIKSDSFFEYKPGDGMQVTGLQVLYGNLVVFKETSIHRSAVQGQSVPISRTDEVSPDIGCIAPAALINVDNILYFLSWKGFMSYDGNKLEKIDGAFDEELQIALRNAGKDIRYASCGYNSHYNEIYLNVPGFIYGEDAESPVGSDSETRMYTYNRSQYGHIYVINIDKQYVTKFGYQPATEYGDPNPRNLSTPSQFCRMYYANSLGELRSADMWPVSYPIDATDPKLWAGIYIETPIQRDKYDMLYQDCDEHPTIASMTDINIFRHAFPQIALFSVKSRFKSKFFTGESETILKRIRNGRYNIYSQGNINIYTIVIPYDDSSVIKRKTRPDVTDGHSQMDTVKMNEFLDSRIDRNIFARTTSQFLFQPTDKWATRVWNYINNTLQNSRADIYTIFGHPNNPNVDVPITRQTELTTIQATPYLNDPDKPNNESWDDANAKPVLYSIEIDTDLRTQINSIGFHWRAINTYLH